MATKTLSTEAADALAKLEDRGRRHWAGAPENIEHARAIWRELRDAGHGVSLQVDHSGATLRLKRRAS